MTYELAKELKEAGFPQENRFPLEEKDIEALKERGLEEVHFPDLEELIEACGVAFSELNKMTHTVEPPKWAAMSFPCEECGIEKTNDGFGSTPTEAVARLWLAIRNKK